MAQGEKADKGETKKQLSREDVQHVATLAALSLTDDETARMTRELGAIVAYIAELDELDTSDVPPTAMILPAAATSWREDEVRPNVERSEALAMAPRHSDEGFLVPAFVDATGGKGTTGTTGGGGGS